MVKKRVTPKKLSVSIDSLASKEIFTCVSDTKKRLTKIFGNTSDLYIESFYMGKQEGLICYLTTMTNSTLIVEKIHDKMSSSMLTEKNIVTQHDWEELGRQLFSGSQYRSFQTEQDMIRDLMNGYVLLFMDGMNKSLSVLINETEKRAIQEPSTQTIIRGPKDSFVEKIDTNLSLIRRRIKSPSLRFDSLVIGEETQTTIQIAYMDGIVNSGILKEVKKRLTDIKTNAIIESNNIGEFISDKTLTVFPMLYDTERPDVVSAHLLSGKIAIFVDGTPFVLTLPCVFIDFMSSSEDYYQFFMMGSLIRGIRYLSFMLALLLPAIYVAVNTYHHEMIPTPLIISIISQREGVPFPAVVEVILMEITFEILREAGVRMPRAVGGTISIVGGLVIGQAAVEAGIISNLMVVVVALTAIASFVSPVYSFSISARLLRFAFVIAASIFGLYGIILGLFAMVGHLASLRSFGVPYLSPVAPFNLRDQKDVFIRLPIWLQKKRPLILHTEDDLKQPNAKSPSPPKEES